VRPGEAIAADGQVQFGRSAMDTSMMTGEPVPAEVASGCNIAAIPLAAGFLNPVIDGAAMAAPSVFMVASGMRLCRSAPLHMCRSAPPHTVRHKSRGHTLPGPAQFPATILN
jgi:cation transport ATPase